MHQIKDESELGESIKSDSTFVKLGHAVWDMFSFFAPNYDLSISVDQAGTRSWVVYDQGVDFYHSTDSNSPLAIRLVKKRSAREREKQANYLPSGMDNVPIHIKARLYWSLDRSCEELGGFQCSTVPECVSRSHVCNGKMDCSDGSDETRCRSMCSEHNITLTEPGMLRLKFNVEKNKNGGSPRLPDRRTGATGVKKGSKSKYTGYYHNGMPKVRKRRQTSGNMDVFACFKQYGTNCKKYLNKNGAVNSYTLPSGGSVSSGATTSSGTGTSTSQSASAPSVSSPSKIEQARLNFNHDEIITCKYIIQAPEGKVVNMVVYEGYDKLTITDHSCLPLEVIVNYQMTIVRSTSKQILIEADSTSTFSVRYDFI